MHFPCEDAAFDIDSCTMDGSDRLKPKCPVLNENQTPAFPEWLTIILLCIYLLFANILLLNLLIAIFKWVCLAIFEAAPSRAAPPPQPPDSLLHVCLPRSFTFEEVQENTDRIWKFQRYELIKEYHSRPAAPPPFIIFSHLYILIRFLVLCRPQVLHKQFSESHSANREPLRFKSRSGSWWPGRVRCCITETVLPENEEDELLSWEALMKDRYLLKMQEEHNQSMERRILDTSQK